LIRPVSRTWHYGLLAFIAGISLLSGNASLPLIDRDEPRFAQATREMIQRGEWVIPYFNQAYRFDKPVMTYWLMRASFFVFGNQGEFPARFHSALAALLVAFALYEIGRRWFGAMVGLWAAGGWLTCLQVLIHGRMAVADMPLILAIVLSHWAAWEMLGAAKFRWRWFVVLYGSLSFGFLAKGPLAFICPLLTLVLYRWVFWRKPLPWGNLKLHWGLPLAVLVIGAWGLPALMETQGLFFDVGIGKHVVERAITPFHSRSFSVFYYLVSSIPSLFPWTAFLGSAWAVIRTQWSEKQAFLLSWFVGPYLVFSFYATQLPHYVLPAYPAAFLLLAQNLTLSKAYSRSRNIIFTLALVSGLVVAGILSGMAMMEEFSPETLPLRGVLLSLSGLISALTLLVWIARRKLSSALIIPLLGIGLCMSQGAAYLRQASPAVQLVPLFQRMPPETQCFYHGFEEASLVYYSNRHWDELNQQPEGRRVLEQAGPRLLVLLKTEYRLEDYWASRSPRIFQEHRPKIPQLDSGLYQDLKRMGYQSVAVEGVNTARLSWVQVEAWYKEH
jgi:4-amino-4-deoxy-L-arabinose transferase-like glycosyltransferase